MQVPLICFLTKKLLIKKHSGQSMCHFHKVCEFLFKCSQFNLVGFLQSLILPYCVKPQEILWMWFYLRFYCSMDLLLIFFLLCFLPSSPHTHPALFFGKWLVDKVGKKAMLWKLLELKFLGIRKLPVKKKKTLKWRNTLSSNSQLRGREKWQKWSLKIEIYLK